MLTKDGFGPSGFDANVWYIILTSCAFGIVTLNLRKAFAHFILFFFLTGFPIFISLTPHYHFQPASQTLRNHLRGYCRELISAHRY